MAALDTSSPTLMASTDVVSTTMASTETTETSNMEPVILTETKRNELIRRGYTPFAVACYDGTIDSFYYLMKEEITEDDVKYGIRAACEGGQHETMEFLIEHYFEIDCFKCRYLIDAFLYACEQKYINITYTLYEYLKSRCILNRALLVNGFLRACGSGDSTTVHFFLDLYDGCLLSCQDICDGLDIAVRVGASGSISVILELNDERSLSRKKIVSIFRNICFNFCETSSIYTIDVIEAFIKSCLIGTDNINAIFDYKWQICATTDTIERAKQLSHCLNKWLDTFWNEPIAKSSRRIILNYGKPKQVVYD